MIYKKYSIKDRIKSLEYLILDLKKIEGVNSDLIKKFEKEKEELERGENSNILL